MFETIAVLFVFFILLIVGLIFYSGVERKSLENDLREFNQLRVIENAQLISFLPELECPTSLEKDNCIDLYKIKVVEDIFEQNKVYYYDIFGFSTVTVIQIFPQVIPPEDGKWIIYDNPKDDTIPEEERTSSKIRVPVSLYDSIDKKYKFAILDITNYG